LVTFVTGNEGYFVFVTGNEGYFVPRAADGILLCRLLSAASTMSQQDYNHFFSVR
jgi:hypothetical protein